MATYPLNQAKRDLITYIQAGTLAAGLQELQEEAGVATAAVKTIPPTAPPSTPSSPLPNVGILQNALTWSAVTGASSYTVYWGIASGVTKSGNKLDPVTANDLVHSGLDSGKTYYYAITASNAAGESALSAEVSAQPIAKPVVATPNLPAPANLRVQMVGGAAVITFDAPLGAATFDVYKDATSSATKTDRIFTGKSTNLYVDTASDASKSFYSIIAVDINGTAGFQSAAKQATPAGESTTRPLTAPYQLH